MQTERDNLLGNNKFKYVGHFEASTNNQNCFLQVTARGSPDMPLSWPFDLQLGLTRLMGMLCGATLNANPGKFSGFKFFCSYR